MLAACVIDDADLEAGRPVDKRTSQRYDRASSPGGAYLSGSWIPYEYRTVLPAVDHSPVRQAATASTARSAGLLRAVAMTNVLSQELLEHAPASAIDAIEHRAEQVTAAVREQIRA